MSKQVPWTRFILNEFYKSAVLSDEEIYIMETRVKGVPISRQAMDLHCSESRVSRLIAQLKRKYDKAQKENPNLPPRKFSAEETWMDEN